MIKRILPLVAVLTLLVAFFAVPAFGATYDIVNYNDFVTDVQVDGNNDLVTVTFPASICGTQENDYYGNNYFPGSASGSVLLKRGYWYGAGYYSPGSHITKVYLDASNIPSGSIVTFTGSLWLSNISNGIKDTVSCDYWVAAEYYNSDRFSVGADFYDFSVPNMTDETRVYNFSESVTINKPAEAAYIVLLVRFRAEPVSVSSQQVELSYSFGSTKLQMSISSLYRLQEQTGKTNELLDKIANGTVDGKPPVGSDSVGDLDDIEGGLKDNTAAGREEAEEIFNESSGLVASHMSGFLFLSNVIERMLSVGWLRGVVVISLSLGILGFLANIAMIAGRNGRDGRDAKSTKGG